MDGNAIMTTKALRFKVPWNQVDAVIRRTSSQRFNNIYNRHLRILKGAALGYIKYKTPAGDRGSPTYRRTGKRLRDSWVGKETIIKGLIRSITIENEASHADEVLPILELGTKRGYQITARPGSALKFFWRGQLVIVKSVRHPGISPYHIVKHTRNYVVGYAEYIMNKAAEEFAKSGK